MTGLDALQARIGYVFSDEKLLVRALTHRSKGSDNNERLEFLGDSILGFIVADWLYQNFPGIAEGKLSRMRSTVVRKETLARVARVIELNESLVLGEGELKSGGYNRDSILADSVEALIGAVYLDAGVDHARDLVLKHFEDVLVTLTPDGIYKDPKSRLQEYLQQRGMPVPVYDIIEVDGEAHQQVFHVACSIAGHDEPITATGSSRRSAEQSAAEKAFSILTH